MRTSNMLRPVLAATVLLASGAFALAQDYTVTSVSGRWVTPPTSGANTLSFGSTTYTTVNNLPFPVQYFGKAYSSMFVSGAGNVQFNTTGYWYPYAPSGPLTGSYEGFCGVAWAYLSNTGGASGTPLVRWWVDGVAPDRRLIVAWTNHSTVWSTNGTINAQVQFSESTGRIVMAYTGTWNETNSGSPQGYVVCLDEPGGTRFVRPPTGETSGTYYFNPQPPNDWQFDPRVTNFTGTVKYDRLVADASGLGNSVQAGVPLAGLRVELRDATGAPVGFGICDADGAYNIKGLALVGTTVGSVAVTARTAACIVRPTYTSPNPPSAPYSFTIATNVPFNASADLGTFTIGAANDAAGTARAPLHVARSIQQAYEKVKSLSADSLPELEVFYSQSSSEPTSYSRGGTGPATASMRVAGPGSANPDGWDTNVVQRVYARHVLASIASVQGTAASYAFDAVSDDENAFAEGFGYYLTTLVNGGAAFVDTQSASTATTIDLENVQPVTRAGPDVAGWVATSLHDLLDGANEAWDEVDGTGAAATRPLSVVDTFTTAPTASTFYIAWGQLALPDSAGLARNFVRHRLVGDDASEPNDRISEATSFTGPGFRRSNMVLNQYNEDWFQFQLAEAKAGLAADVSADFPGAGSVVTLELRNAADQVVATGVLQAGNILMRAVVPGVSPPGVYRVRVKHESGGRIGSYVVQAYTPLEMTSGAFTPWTVKRPYYVELTAAGGVPPYRVTIEQPFVQPPGLLLDSVNLRVTGSPQQVGTQNFVLSVRDDAVPPNVASVAQSFVVNDELDFEFGEFLCFALGKNVDKRAPFTGGTAPHVFTLGSGSAPSGLTLDVGELRFQGTPDVPGSTPFRVDGSDVAGSTDSAETTAVVAVPLTGASVPADLAAGDSACGFFFDAVYRSTVGVSVKTAAKRVKRPLRLVVLDPSGAEIPGLAIKAGVGKASVAGIPCDATGRYFVVVASDGGDATQLVGALKLALPKKATGLVEDFGAGRTSDVVFGALAGARVTIAFKPDKSGLQLRGNLLRDPAGNATAFLPSELTDDGKGGLVFVKDLPTSGTWTVSVAAKPGLSGSFKWSLKIAQPKGGTFSAD